MFASLRSTKLDELRQRCTVPLTGLETGRQEVAANEAAEGIEKEMNDERGERGGKLWTGFRSPCLPPTPPLADGAVDQDKDTKRQTTGLYMRCFRAATSDCRSDEKQCVSRTAMIDHAETPVCRN